MNTKNKEVSIYNLMVALLFACVAFQLNCSMLSPVLVSMAQELKTNEAVIGVSQTIFFTSAALFSVFIPRLSDIVGRKKMMILMLLIMIIGTLICAMSKSIAMLYIGRGIQGVCGPIVAICLMIVRAQAVSAKQCGLLMGIITSVNGGIAGIDAILGGILAEKFGYHSVFYCIAIIGFISLFLMMFCSTETRPSAGVKMDWLGTLLLVVGVGCLLGTLNEVTKMQEVSWSLVAILMALSVIAMSSFLFYESKTKMPLVPIAYLKKKSAWLLLLTTTLTLCGTYALVNGIVMSLAQNQHAGFGLSAQWAGFALLTPFALIGWLVGPFVGSLAPKLGYVSILRRSLWGCVIAIGIMSYAGVYSLSMLIAITFLLGVFYAGMTNIMLNSLGVLFSPDDNAGFLPGLNAGAFNLGAGLSFAIIPAVQFFTDNGGEATIHGYQAATNAGLIITIFALFTSYFIPKPVIASVTQKSQAILG